MERILKSKYKILEKIAESSSHSTYCGTFTDSDKPLIIKIFSRDILNSVLTKKLKKDVQALAKLEHGSIPRVYDGDYGWQGFYFIRDFVEGKTLLEMKKPFEAETACELMARACDIISFAHEKGFVHGSITPKNIFVSKKNVYVSDFGIESAVNQMLEQKALFLLSEDSNYLPPEVVLGEEPGIRSDIYQAGMVLYFLVTGELPLEKASGLNSALKSLNSGFAPPSAANGKVPKYLDEIVMKCLQRDPLLRFDDMAQLSGSLKGKMLMLRDRDSFELSELDLASEEPEEKKEEPVFAGVPIPQEKSDKINLFRWIMFAVWTAIAAGIIYSLIQIFIIGE